MVRLVGDALSVKSPTGAAVTTNVTGAAWLRPPLVPVIVSGWLPVGVADDVATVSVELFAVTGFGLKVALAPPGITPALSETGPANPAYRVIVTV
jgi:hypothetical protein